MKKLFVLTVISMMSFSFLPAHAAENIRLDGAGAVFSDIEHTFPVNAFRVIADEDGKFVSKPGQIFTDGGDYSGMTLPFLVSAPTPIAYPRWAVSQGWQGEFVVAIEILTDGSVGRHAVIQSTKHDVLDQAAVDAVKTWQFHPAMKSGEPVVTCVELPVKFELMQQA